ncbi:CrcB family protein [Streptomyces sp. NPDC048279]|uniref:FluC/FEX family fluoride channel n=1 Tax=Streptomyces sp. NPDC048279 TaxID=3154714 RepID=UPI0034162222
MNCDFDALAVSEHRWRAWGGAVVAVVAAGGVLGAEARDAALRLWPRSPDGFPLTTFTVNVAGRAVIGVVLVVLSEMRDPSRPLTSSPPECSADSRRSRPSPSMASS